MSCVNKYNFDIRRGKTFSPLVVTLTDSDGDAVAVTSSMCRIVDGSKVTVVDLAPTVSGTGNNIISTVGLTEAQTLALTAQTGLQYEWRAVITSTGNTEIIYQGKNEIIDSLID